MFPWLQQLGIRTTMFPSKSAWLVYNHVSMVTTTLNENHHVSMVTAAGWNPTMFPRLVDSLLLGTSLHVLECI